jgi:extracellular elastinolytic metalloproteinase
MGWLTAANQLTAATNPNVRIVIAQGAGANTAVNCPNGVCNFALNLAQAPTVLANQRAAATNAFYVANTVHDVQYQYGFNEAAGNFQEINAAGTGGRGGDNVTLRVQATGNCNANFATPADGTNPTMNMFLCNRGNPQRDGDFDAGVIIHEYGHGISTRQIGGPSRACRLTGQQQAGEGWSDWLGLVYTARTGDTGPQVRGTGSYLFNMNPLTGTIRDLPYSTNNAVNNWTYESAITAGLPHGVGSRWAQAIWEVYWNLVNARGFEQDLINFDGPMETAGNKRALFYINEGFKNTRCGAQGPNFLNNRDGILQVAMSNYGGQDVCLIWDAFADFGLGTNAVSPTNGTRTGIRNGFNVPAMCANQRVP